MKNKEGFTLIELLAVIVILAIVSLILIPSITGVIIKAREKSAMNSAVLYIGAVQNGINKKLLVNTNEIENGNYILDGPYNVKKETTTIEVEASGDLPKNGNLDIDKNGIPTACINIMGYNVRYDNGKTSIVQTCNNEIVEYPTPTDISCFEFVSINESEAGIKSYKCGGYYDDNGTIVSSDDVLHDGSVMYPVVPLTVYMDASTSFIVNYDTCIPFALQEGATSEAEAKNMCDSLAKEVIDYPDQVTQQFIDLGLISKKQIQSGTKTVTSIENSAFSNSNSNRYSTMIYGITLSNNIKYIGDSAFYKNKLTSISIPSSVEKIGTAAFCNNEINNLNLQKSSSLKNVGNSAFADNKITDLVLSSNIEIIGYYAFKNNRITRLVLNNNIKEIKERSFSGNNIQNKLHFPNLIQIGDEAFKNNQIPFISFDESPIENSYITYSIIGNNAFNGNRISGTLVLPNTVKIIGDSAFENNNISGDLTLPNELISIGNSAFYQNNIDNLVIGNKLETIERSAFGNNKISGKIVFPDTLKKIGWYAFSSNKITSTKFGNSLEIIEEGAFYNNAISDDMVIPDSMITIEKMAFVNNKIKSLKLGNKVESVGEAAFYNNNLSSLILNNQLSNIGLIAFNSNVLPDDQATIYARKSDKTIDKTRIIGYGNRNARSYVVPNDVITIGAYAFMNNNLEIVTISNTVKEIQKYAFISNKISSLILGNSVETIEYGAFGNDVHFNFDEADAIDNINAITSLNLPDSLKDIGESAFYNVDTCNQTSPSTCLSSLSLGKGVINIGNNAFRNNKLTTIVLPETLTTIGSGAFYGYSGTELVIPSSVKSIGGVAFQKYSGCYGACNEGTLKNVIVNGKSSIEEFTSFPNTNLGWAYGYNNANIIWKP